MRVDSAQVRTSFSLMRASSPLFFVLVLFILFLNYYLRLSFTVILQTINILKKESN
jgi:hypothetical protein